MKQVILATTFLFVWFGGADGQGSACPPSSMTGEALKAQLLDFASKDGGNRITSLVLMAIGPASGCPRLGDAEDVQPVLNEIIRFVALQDNANINLYFFDGVLLGLGNREATGVGIPLDALAFAVEEAKSASALRILLRLAEDDDVHAYLLRLARARQGPPGWSSLPEGIIEVIFRFPTEEDARLRAALAAEPSRILNPAARCRVETRGRPAHTPPVPCP